MLRLSWDERWELEGQFWLPGDDRRFYGRLRHSPEEGTELHAVDTPLMDRRSAEPPDPFLPALHGASVHGDALSLLDVYTTHWESSATDTIDAVVVRVVAGSPHITDLDTTRARRVTVGLHGLREAFAGVWPYGGGVLRPRKVSGGRRASMKAELAEGGTLEIEVGTNDNIVRGRRVPQEYARAVFEFEDERSYAELLTHHVEPLRDFVAFTTRRRSYVTSVYLSQGDDPFGWRVVAVPHPPGDPREARAVHTLAVDLSELDDP
jgi:hypothetical protein